MVLRPSLMAQHITFFSSALVALYIQTTQTLAAPLNSQLPGVWMASITDASIEAAVTEVVTSANPSDWAAAAQIPPSTVTLWSTETVTASPTEPSGAVATVTPSSWTLPETFADVSPLQINKLAYGSSNINIVTGIPATASASSAPPAAASADPSGAYTPLPRSWTNSSSAYRLLYPSGSINPANRPQGGAEFYATPGNLQFKAANNVTLEYSIFFPIDFEWVQGGKLPGIYGGHEGCSGGNSAKSCFSTRLMWRKGGAGELYLYAPKDKQTPELCNAPPQSVCDAAYGLSVGRGSFHFAPGRWTHVSQTVRLNTPGMQDGGFELLVNRQRIMRRDDIFYRDVPQSDNDEGGTEGGNEGGSGQRYRGIMRRDVEPQAAMNIEYDIDDLLPLLSFDSQIDEILGGVVPEQVPTPPGPSGESAQDKNTITMTATVTATPNSSPQVQATSQPGDRKAVGFSGLFFSTFFGGHGQEWASPKDQYTWFKDFGMSVNA